MFNKIIIKYLLTIFIQKKTQNPKSQLHQLYFRFHWSRCLRQFLLLAANLDSGIYNVGSGYRRVHNWAESGRRLRDVTLGLSPAEIRSAWVLYWQVERWPRGMPSDRRRGFIAPSGVVTALLLIIYLCWCPRFLFSWINFCAIVYVLI